jgi:type IV secretory pathway VirB2 component (pilin)
MTTKTIAPREARLALFLWGLAALVVTVWMPFAAAHAQVLVADAQNVSTWALTLIRVIAVLFIIAGFITFAAGRHHWAGGIAMLVGVIGAAKADQVAAYLGLGG